MPANDQLPNDAGVLVLSLAVDCIAEGEWDGLYTRLNAAERARADAFRFDEDRRAYVSAHGLLRLALSSLGGGSPADWRFETNSYGKPHLVPRGGLGDLRFSLTHTRGMVAIALAYGTEIGIDVEARERMGRLDLEIADSHFTPEEVQALRTLPHEDARRDRFLRLWTLKESFVKATGRGLSQPLDEFTVLVDPVRFVEHKRLGGGRWYGADWRLGGYRLAAVADWLRDGTPRFIHRALPTPLRAFNSDRLAASR